MGFYVTTENGHQIHINGDRKMPDDTLKAICRMMDLAIEQASKSTEEEPPESDEPKKS